MNCMQKRAKTVDIISLRIRRAHTTEKRRRRREEEQEHEEQEEEQERECIRKHLFAQQKRTQQWRC